jgi:hypothetical protein
MPVCKKNMKLEDCELAILRLATDKAEKKLGARALNIPDVQRIISIVEHFLQSRKLLCYGGTAINNILPVEDQFYDRGIEMPDYDFYSSSALKDAKDLADIYKEEGYDEIEAKTSSIHPGTYKVYVNYIPVADISQMDKKLFDRLYSEALIVNDIHYVPPNFLRMAMYLELSRPAGDVSRWEKVLKRLILLNKNYPLTTDKCSMEIQRGVDDKHKGDQKKLYYTVRDSFINQGLIFFGGYANLLYSHYMPKQFKKKFKVKEIPDFDVLSKNPEKSATIVKERLEAKGFKKVKIQKQKGVGEVIAPHYEIIVDGETVAFIYEPLACHSYNKIKIKGKTVKVATIDTMLSFYLAFIYADRDYYDVNRILCMADLLFAVQQKNRLEQKGLLERFSIICYGKQETLDNARAHKAEKFREFKNIKNRETNSEYLKYFFKYNPNNEEKKSRKKTKRAKKTKKGGKNMKYTRKI